MISALLSGSEAWCQGQSEIRILQTTERATVRSMCGVKLVLKKSAKDLIRLFYFKETIDLLTKANSVL